ncbi:MAG: hypothetical protein QOG15_2551 [Solirubrobacteraceae bacterium]|jgi:diguanylate cyclase (GGDEF)-like protein/PAS domain S-box-containing protein|nr:hypothetical protein [Solirubrobacteraceae bacterium]
MDTAAEPAAAILVVDDDPAQRLTISTMLAPLGHDIVEAQSGADALRAVLRRAFAVILMEVRMPIMDGYKTAELIRQRAQSRRTPIIFVTAFGPGETETASAYASGAVDLIFAPFLREVLQAKVAIFVELFQQAQELKYSLESITSLNTALRDSEVRSRAVLQNVSDAIVTAGEDGRIESFNRSARQLFGYSEEEVLGKPLEVIVARSHHADFSYPARRRESLQNATDVPEEPSESVGCRKDGSCFPMEMDMSQMQIGERTFTIASIRDISGRRAYTEALKHRTLHDDLTGLPNRTLFGDRMDQAIASADRADQPCGVLMINLKAFGEINDTLGREVGNALLQAVADSLRGVVRDTATLGRVGGDDFAILPSGESGVEATVVLAWKIREAWDDQPFVINGNVIDVRASIGIACFPQHGRTTAELLRRADLAMAEAQRSGSGLAVFAIEAEDRTAQRLSLMSELRDGIPRGELVLHFQPKIDLATRRTIGVEALVRWQHPTDGLLMPAQFMGEVDRSELIQPLTRWVLDAALHQQRLWSDAGLDLTMAVNVSAASLTLGSDLPDVVAELIDSWGITAGTLILELTENALIDNAVPHVLNALHAMGVVLTIDDFGTGHSSLVYLQRLPIDEIKIDRSFVKNLASVPSDAVIVRSTIDLAHNLGLTVVTEGVEDEAALDMLIQYGSDDAQGFFFSRPDAPEAVTVWMTESPFGAQLDAGG